MRIKFSRTRISWSPLPGESWHLRWRYMIPIRLPWRPRARPSATLHEIPAYSVKSKLEREITTDLLGLSRGSSETDLEPAEPGSAWTGEAPSPHDW
jgi:hypothetical protein